ncbi:MAG: hypothetical protein Q6L68_15320 [Thermostichus sp. DG02_5_bins_236]
MKAHEFLAHTGMDGQLILPKEAQERLPKNRIVRVLVLVDDLESGPMDPTDPFQRKLTEPHEPPDEDSLWLESPTIPYDGI